MTAWPLNVTWAMLLAFAWARNSEYGIVADVDGPGAKIRNAFQTSRPDEDREPRPARELQPGRGGGGLPGG